MRIAMIGPFGLRPNQTMRRRALGLARPLVQRGHQVALFMPPWQTPAEADRRWQEDSVEIRYIPLAGKRAFPGSTLAVARRLIRETLAWQPDVVHCFKPKAYSGLVAWWLWQFHRRRLRLVTDTDDWEGWGGWNEVAPYTHIQKRFFAWQERWGFRHCHALTVASRALQSIAWSQGVPSQRVVYVPNGPGISRQAVVGNEGAAADWKRRQELGLGERPTVLLYSRLFEFDTERLVAILAGVKTAVPDVAVLAVGAGLYDTDERQFRQQLAEASLQEAIVDLGWVEAEALPDTLAAADVGIYLMDDTLLNRTKCPVKLADILYLGVPVVAEAVGQVPEYVVQDRSGLLRPSGDVAGITADLVHLLQDTAERERLATGAKRHIVTHFSWQRLSELVEHAYVGPMA
jgi:glycosyltransferase involved in cell wall biosynthesis